MSKKLKYLIIHCTDTPEGREVTKADIEQWHLVENGWSKVGYSDMVHIDGSLESLIPFDLNEEVDSWEISNGARGFNSVSRHVVYVGGKGKDTRTKEQERTLMVYCYYMILRHPDLLIGGHNQFSEKDCPSFDVPLWLQSIAFPDKNILKGKV